MDTLDRFLPKGLFVFCLGLVCWGLLGLLEYFFPGVRLGLQNRNFPPALQFIHFFAIALTGFFYVIGYLKRWPHTPHASITMYAVLASLCFVETIDFGAFGGGTTGIMIMMVEFSAYLGLSFFLLRSKEIKERFHGAPGQQDGQTAK